MNDSTSVNEKAVQKTPTGNKIKELVNRLEDQHKAGSSASEILSVNQLAMQLFARAPADFLEANTIDSLISITDKCSKALIDFAQAKEKVLVECSSKDQFVAIVAVLADRPFIINTITETVRELGTDIRVFVHPIIKTGRSTVSLSYIEIETVNGYDLPTLQKDLKRALEALVLATEDFTSMLVRTDTLSRLLENPRFPAPVPQVEQQEIAEFLRWLVDGGFVFLGHAEWSINKGEKLSREPKDRLGIFRQEDSSLLEETREDIARLRESSSMVSTTTLRSKSLVQRRTRLTHVALIECAHDGSCSSIHSFVGVLTSKARSQESSSIPLIRRKLQRLLEAEDCTPNSFNYKALVNLIDHMPKDDALRLDISALHTAVQKTLGVYSKHGTRIAIMLDPAKRSATVLIVMPRERFNADVRRRLQRYVEGIFNAQAGSSEYLLDISDKTLARFYFSVAVPASGLPKLEIAEIEQAIAELSREWRDELESRLREASLSNLIARYSEAFPEEYRACQSASDACDDISELEQVTSDHPIRVRHANEENEQQVTDAARFTLIVYRLASEMTISQAFPVLENSGLEVLSERSARITPGSTGQVCYVHRFLVRQRHGLEVKAENFNKYVGPGLVTIFSGQAINDPLNALLINAHLDVRSISLLRTYGYLLSQINKFATRHAICNVLASNPDAAVMLWRMFELRFNPIGDQSIEQRQNKFAKSIENYWNQLNRIKDISEDRVLRGLALLLEHTVRTNFYQARAGISIKIHSEHAEIIPQPRPKFEIFVNTPIVEGVHLRSSRVARGGLRWSERRDDYRTEVLGLMKTQKIKNALIVPHGAKGGFIVRNMPDDGAKVRAAVETAYREFISELLSLADNRNEQGVVHPPQVLVYDGEDPYFVVAADKGTSTFSDVANQIAQVDYQFWLGDAFASGGSNGYDHKLYGITARGVWECVKRHFHEIGIDYINKPFTVVGVGDMSGDVFGNGLLLSEQIQLLAAFDHRQIFIDPNPDPKLSFVERKRLFDHKGSQWSDYDKKLLSKGGGVYGRFDKEIKLSPEARRALDVSDETPEILNSEQVISLILRAKVDLLWNGGIGTYVKSRLESNPDVNDSSNDRVRINSDELRARVVGEGGNLGFTQLSRIEISKRGGCINTDAIDNSGGVDLSDHEVNIKILCAQLLKDKKITLEERNKLLKEMAVEVCDDVLSHNRSQSLLISMSIERSRRNIEYLRTLMNILSKQGYLNRTLEGLPDDDELTQRAARKEGFTRPELAVCLAIVKLWIKDAFLASELCNDPLLQSYLLEYFPTALRKRYAAEILAHPLARNIIATQVVNTLVDNLGVTFLYRLSTSQGVSVIDVVKCALAAEMVLDLKKLRQDLKTLDTPGDNSVFFELLQESTRAMRAVASWFLSAHGAQWTLKEMVEAYAGGYRAYIEKTQQALLGAEQKQFEVRLERLRTHKLDAFCTKSLAAFPFIIPLFEMLSVSRESKRDTLQVTHAFFHVLDALGVNEFVTGGGGVLPASRWENELRLAAFDEIRQSLSLLTVKLLDRNITNAESIRRLLEASPRYELVKLTVEELKSQKGGVAALSVLAKQLKNYAIK